MRKILIIIFETQTNQLAVMMTSLYKEYGVGSDCKHAIKESFWSCYCFFKFFLAIMIKIGLFLVKTYNILYFLKQEFFTLVTCRTFMYQLKYHHQNRDYHIFHCHHRKAYNNKGIILRSGQSGREQLCQGLSLSWGSRELYRGRGPKHLPS